MTCEIRHDYHRVNNHYTDGRPTKPSEGFSDGEWRTETVCKKCRHILILNQ